MADPFQDAQDEMDELDRQGGDQFAFRAIRKMLVVLRLLASRIKRLEERVDRLDPPPP